MRPHLVVRKRVYEFGHVHRDPGRDAGSFASSVGERRHDGALTCFGAYPNALFYPHVFSRQRAPLPRCLTSSQGALFIFTGLKVVCYTYSCDGALSLALLRTYSSCMTCQNRTVPMPRAKEGGRGGDSSVDPPWIFCNLLSAHDDSSRREGRRGTTKDMQYSTIRRGKIVSVDGQMDTHLRPRWFSNVDFKSMLRVIMCTAVQMVPGGQRQQGDEEDIATQTSCHRACGRITCAARTSAGCSIWISSDRPDVSVQTK